GGGTDEAGPRAAHATSRGARSHGRTTPAAYRSPNARALACSALYERCRYGLGLPAFSFGASPAFAVPFSAAGLLGVSTFSGFSAFSAFPAASAFPAFSFARAIG